MHGMIAHSDRTRHIANKILEIAHKTIKIANKTIEIANKSMYGEPVRCVRTLMDTWYSWYVHLCTPSMHIHVHCI